MTEERQTHRYVCMGLREWGGKFVVAYLDEDGQERAWSGKKNIGTIIGGTYRVEIGDDPGTIYIGSSQFVGMSQDPDHKESISQWRLQDRTARNTQEAQRAAKRLQKENSDLGDLTLREIKALFRSNLAHQRQGMLTAVNHYLTTGY
jgi:hypothetical protein